jgi:hypothetical protein
VHAALLFLMPGSSQIGVGETMTVEVRINSEGTSFNAAQVVINYPKELLEVTLLDKTGSTFSLWINEPHFSNANGTVSFTGGTPYGVSGGAVSVLKIQFRAKAVGSGKFSLTAAAVSAADGSGSNILSRVQDASVTVVPQRSAPPPASPQVIPPPEQIVRTPTPSGGLPIQPVLKIPLYPDQNGWYNSVAPFTASWGLPPDISGVSTALDKDPNTIPPEKSEGLFDNKTFGILDDGIWYLHVRFQNNVGWGPATHYRIAIDTQPPLGFKAVFPKGDKTDDPIPTLQFTAADALSGIQQYQIRVGTDEPIVIPAKNFTGSFDLALQAPGKKSVLIKAIDQADNGIENRVTFEILPIASPAVTFVTRVLYFDEDKGMSVKGTALPNTDVLLKVQKVLQSGGRGEVVAQSTAHVNEKGNWEFVFDQAFKIGRYVITAQSKDARGALSLTVESPEVIVQSKPIIQIGMFQLGMEGAIILLLAVIAGGFGGGVWFYKKRQEKLTLRLTVVKTDMVKVFKLILEDVQKLKEALETPTEADDEFAMKRLQANISKMEGYLKKELEKVK